MALTQERLLELQNQLEGLGPEEQQARMAEILSPEELEELRIQQCPFCLITAGKIKAKVVYKDDSITGVLDINPANKGHVILFPNEHMDSLYALDDYGTGRIFKVAARMGKVLEKVMGANGSNIHVANGAAAGQNVPHLIVHVIPRFENDGISFAWTPKKMSEREMDEIAEKIKAVGLRLERDVVEVKPVVEEGEFEEAWRIP